MKLMPPSSGQKNGDGVSRFLQNVDHFIIMFHPRRRQYSNKCRQNANSCFNNISEYSNIHYYTFQENHTKISKVCTGQNSLSYSRGSGVDYPLKSWLSSLKYFVAFFFLRCLRKILRYNTKIDIIASLSMLSYLAATGIFLLEYIYLIQLLKPR